MKYDDQLAVVFAKIGFYCDILRNFPINLKLTLLEDLSLRNAFPQLFKIQAFINRYHACIYEREIVS